jgi:hypothetical protein
MSFGRKILKWGIEKGVYLKENARKGKDQGKVDTKWRNKYTREKNKGKKSYE